MSETKSETEVDSESFRSALLVENIRRFGAGEPLLNVVGQVLGRLARGHDVFDQGCRNPPIRPDRDAAFAQIGVPVDENAQLIAGADDVLVRRRAVGRHVRIGPHRSNHAAAGGWAGAPGQRPDDDQKEDHRAKA